MVYRITLAADFLRAELFDRETADEVKSFLRIVADVCEKNQRTCILLRIEPLTPMFQDDPYELFRYIGALPLPPSWKIALVGDTTDFQATHESVEAVAGKFKLNLWTFQNEAQALLWFRDWRQRGERRKSRERRQLRKLHAQRAVPCKDDRRDRPERRLRTAIAAW
jgi:hypothetical protein